MTTCVYRKLAFYVSLCSTASQSFSRVRIRGDAPACNNPFTCLNGGPRHTVCRTHATLNYSTRTSTVLYRLYLPVQYYRLYLRCNLHTTIDYTYGNDYGILLYASTVLPAVIVLVLVLQRRNALYAYPYFAGGIKATCEFSSKWSSENGQNASTNIPYYLRSYIEGFPCVPRNFRRFILLAWAKPYPHPTVMVQNQESYCMRTRMPT